MSAELALADDDAVGHHDGRARPAVQPPADRSDGGSAVAPLLAMAELCTPGGLAALERALTSYLRPEQTPAAESVEDLLALTELLNSSLARHTPHHRIAPVQVERKVYDELRPEGTPTSKRLVRAYGGAQHGGWLWACRAAWGLLPDGRKRGPGVPRPNPMRGKSRPPRSTAEDVIRSIRTCALQRGERPSSATFAAWALRYRRRRRRHGGRQLENPERIYGIDSVYVHFPDWPTALAAARITDAELAEARARWAVAGPEPEVLPGATPAGRLGALTDEELQPLGLTPGERNKLVKRGCGALPLGQAVLVAARLGGSLEWLAGVSAELGERPASEAALDATVVKRAAKQAGVRTDGLRRAVQMDASSWRALLGGRREPTLGQLRTLADRVGCPMTELVRAG